MRYYPIFVNLENRECLVVGAGEVGMRKIRTLLDCNASKVTVIDRMEPQGDMLELLERPNLSFECREFRQSDLDGKMLVIASTSSEETNWEISRLCNKRGILCNIVDQPEKCSFIVPATVTQGDLTLAVSTGGQSPAFAKRIRKDLQQSFGAEFAGFLMIMGRLRPMVLELGLETKQNTKIFRGVVDSDLLELLESNDFDAAGLVLRDVLPEPLHSKIPELLHGLA